MPMLGFRPVLQANRLWWNEHGLPPQVPPKAWWLRSSASLEIDHWIVRFSTGSFFACPPSVVLHVAVEREVLVEPPARRDVVDDHVADRVAAQGVVADLEGCPGGSAGSG